MVRKPEVGAEARAHALGHGRGDFRADRAVRFDQRGRHAQELDLGFVGVADDAAQIERADARRSP